MNKPKEIRFEVTRHCNCQCFFCHNKNTFAQDGKRIKKDLNTAQAKSIIDKIADEGIGQIRFTGGEPLLRVDILELINYAKSKGLSVRINTNGTLVNPEIAKKLVTGADMVLISIPSLNEEENDNQTGLAGGFKKKIKTIKLLKNKKEDFLWACTVATKKNIDELDRIASWMYDLGVDYWFCLRQIPTTQDKNPYSIDDCEKLIKKLTIIKNKYSDKYRDGEVLNNPFPFCAIREKKEAASVCSGAFYGEGHSALIIDPDGNILVDYAYNKKVGNIFNNSIMEVWNSTEVKKFREYDLAPAQCLNCEWLNKCKGGSRVAAYVALDTISGRDPLMK